MSIENKQVKSEKLTKLALGLIKNREAIKEREEKERLVREEKEKQRISAIEMKKKKIENKAEENVLIRYAKNKGMALAEVYHNGVEGLGVLVGLTKKYATFAMENEVRVKIDIEKDHDNFVMIREHDDYKIKNKYVVDPNEPRWNMYPYPSKKMFSYLENKYEMDYFDSLFPEKKQNILQKKYTRYGDTIVTQVHGFFGEGAGDIAFADERDFVQAMAYLATPGKTSFIADVPPNHEDAFNELYPYAHYGHTRSHDGNSCQFTIAIHGSEDIPYLLANEVMPSDEKYLGTDKSIRIIRSAFAYDLVENRGFVFGKEQNVDEIRKRIPTEELKERFDEELEYFSRNLEEDRGRE